MSSRLPKHHIRTSMTCTVIAAMAFFIGVTCLDGAVLTLLAIKLGGQEFFIGLVNFVLPVAGIFSLLSISSMERFGKKKVLITGFVFAFLFIIPLFFLPYIHNRFGVYAGLALLFTATALRSVANAMGGVGWFPILQDFVPAKLTGRFFANLRTFWQSAWLVSLLCIAYFFKGDNPAWWRFEVAFAIALTAYIIRTLAVLPMSQKHTDTAKTKTPAITQRIKAVFAYQPVRIFLLYIIFYFAAISMAEPFKVKLLKDFGYGYGFILSANASVCLGAIVSLRFWGKIADRFGNRAIFNISHIAMIAVSLLWIFVKPTVFGSILVFILYFLTSVFNSANGIAQTRYMLHSVPADKQYFLTIIQMVTGIAVAIGPLAAGIFLANTKSLDLHLGNFVLNNYSLMFIFTACLFTVPQILAKKLIMTKETSTLEVLAIVSRPIRNFVGPFLTIKRNRQR